jgi:hypothetical protein
VNVVIADVDYGDVPVFIEHFAAPRVPGKTAKKRAGGRSRNTPRRGLSRRPRPRPRPGCNDPNCEADHGYTGNLTSDDLTVRISAAIEGSESVARLVQFATNLQRATS